MKIFIALLLVITSFYANANQCQPTAVERAYSQKLALEEIARQCPATYRLMLKNPINVRYESWGDEQLYSFNFSIYNPIVIAADNIVNKVITVNVESICNSDPLEVEAVYLPSIENCSQN